MKTTLNIVGIVAAMIITIFISTAGRDSDRTQIRMLESKVKSLDLDLELIRLDLETAQSANDVFFKWKIEQDKETAFVRALLLNQHKINNHMVSVATNMVKTLENRTPPKPTARAR